MRPLVLHLLLVLLTFSLNDGRLTPLLGVRAADFQEGGDRYVTAAGAGGEMLFLRDSRRPALYTGDFGDCLGESALNVTRFDAAYYKDNMTITFHLQGNTGIKNESLMSESSSSHVFLHDEVSVWWS